MPGTLLADLRGDVLQWATVLAAFALFLAFLSIVRVHLARLVGKSRHKIASLLIVVSAVGSLVLVLLQGPEGPLTRVLVRDVLVAGESALLALTAITLLLAGARALQTRRSLGTVVFILVSLFALAAAIPYARLAVLDSAMVVVDTVASAGVRGLVLGVALGITLTGIRLIIGVDRPHSEE